jgi:hypothetical protein
LSSAILSGILRGFSPLRRTSESRFYKSVWAGNYYIYNYYKTRNYYNYKTRNDYKTRNYYNYNYYKTFYTSDAVRHTRKFLLFRVNLSQYGRC